MALPLVCAVATLLPSNHNHTPTRKTTTAHTVAYRQQQYTIRNSGAQGDCEAVNPAVRLLGALLPKTNDAKDPLDDIQWDAHKIRNLSITQMRERVDDGRCSKASA